MPMVELGSFGNRLKALRHAKGISQADLARLIGRHQTAIGPYERDEYLPARDVIDRLAARLDTTPEYLCFGRSPDRRTIPFGGRAGALRGLAPAGGRFAVQVRYEAMLAYEVADDGMAPVFRPGQHLLVAREPAPEPEALLGRHALVDLPDGRALLRRLAPSGAPERFDLAAYAAPTIQDVRLLAARPVLGVLEPEALAPPAQGADGAYKSYG